MQFEFGSGVLVGVRINDFGESGTQTPREFGILQECTVDFAATTKQLFGQYQFPVAVGRGTAKISGNAKFARIFGGIYNDLFFRGTSATGETLMVVDEARSIPTTPFHVTPVNNTTFVEDLTVKYGNNSAATDGTYMTRVTGTPAAAGTYSVTISAGVATYVFDSVDTGLQVLLTYTYTVATGETVTITNPLLGSAPSFELHLRQSYLGQQLYLKLNRCISAKLAFATKLEDFLIPQMDFDAFADASNTIGILSIAE